MRLGLERMLEDIQGSLWRYSPGQMQPLSLEDAVVQTVTESCGDTSQCRMMAQDIVKALLEGVIGHKKSAVTRHERIGCGICRDTVNDLHAAREECIIGIRAEGKSSLIDTLKEMQKEEVVTVPKHMCDEYE